MTRLGLVLGAIVLVLAGLLLQPWLQLTGPSGASNQQKLFVVVGGGAAGMSAALEAARAAPHIQVLLFDKEPRLGGNSAKASSGINGVGTAAQRANAIPDSPELFQADVIRSGQSIADEKLVGHLVGRSSAAIEFLESIGVNLDLLSHCGGHEVPRTHRSSPVPNAKFQRNIGSIITNALAGQLAKQDNIESFTSSPVTALLRRADGSIRGVQVNGTAEYQADAVILASGGYGRDARLLAEFRPDLSSAPSTNGDWSTGDGVHLARAVEAGLTGMEYVQVHPTGIVDPKNPAALNKFLAAEAIRAGGAILINQKGQRFVNELGLRDHVTAAINGACEAHPEAPGQKVAYLVLNQDVIESFGAQTMSFYQHKGFLAAFDNVAAFAAEYQLEEEVVRSTLEAYNMAKSGARTDAFGKSRFPTAFEAEEKLFVFLVTPSIHYTMGGVKIDTTCQVLRADGSVLEGLYAAGEVSGGVHGKNRLAGNSLLECVVFGRTAGQTAVTWNKST